MQKDLPALYMYIQDVWRMDKHNILGIRETM